MTGMLAGCAALGMKRDLVEADCLCPVIEVQVRPHLPPVVWIELNESDFPYIVSEGERVAPSAISSETGPALSGYFITTRMRAVVDGIVESLKAHIMRYDEMIVALRRKVRERNDGESVE